MEIFIITLSITLCVCLGVYWFAKYFDKDEDLFADFVTKTVIKPTTVTCEDCGCEVKIDNAYVVNGFSYKLYYCKKDKKNYDMVSEFPDYSSGKMITRYYKKTDFIEVTKDGEPVGYKKK